MTETQNVFGELKVNQYEFTNCGVKHVQRRDTMSVTLDQIHFASTLKAVAHPQVSSGSDGDVTDADLHALYRSLLGAVAYLAHTRVDILVFICALQRHVASPRVEHARKLNRVLRWVQNNPKKLVYQCFDRTHVQHLRIVSDAAFKKEPGDGYSLRGALYLRTQTLSEDDSEAFVRQAPAHVIEWACKSQRHVTRSTFAAELLSAGDAVDQGILVSHMLQEIETGPMSAEEARACRDSGGFVKTGLHVEAKSVYAAVTASMVKIPADRSLFVHVAYLRELLDRNVVRAMVWLDTRDMMPDGLTKGTVARDLLHTLMAGTMVVAHPAEAWVSKKPSQSVDGASGHAPTCLITSAPKLIDDAAVSSSRNGPQGAPSWTPNISCIVCSPSRVRRDVFVVGPTRLGQFVERAGPVGPGLEHMVVSA